MVSASAPTSESMGLTSPLVTITSEAFWRDLQNCKAYRLVRQPAQGQQARGEAAKKAD